jgi:membrane protein implicated in regulation of membrane protease activity
MSWFADHGWLAWVGIALALGAIELASVDFVFLMLAGGALAGALAALLGVPVVGQVLVSLAVAALALLLVRPVIKRQFTVADARDIGTAAQIGRSALVLSTVTGTDGRIKLGGETWTARTAPDAAACLPGQEVRVVSIEGATAIVTGVAVGRDTESST